MKHKLLASLLFGLTLGAAACAGGGGSGGGSLLIVSCSLGCTGSGPGGVGQISCGIQDVFVNGELRIGFSGPVAESSLTVFTIQVTDSTGKTPPADRFVEPSDPTVVVYRPKLTFDSSGAPVFGLSEGVTYTIKLPGLVEDGPSGPFVESASGAPNRHRMLCTVEASLGILDAKPGAPTATVTVDKVIGYDPVTGDPNDFELGVLADGEVDIFRSSDITITFDDLMNPATLVNPVTGVSNTLRVLIDPDGITSDPSDQQLILGTFAIDLDQDALSTVVTFQSTLGFPSAGSDPVNKRKIVVEMPPAIADLGGNSLGNAGIVTFTPEFVPFGALQIREEFNTAINEQIDASGAIWGGGVGELLPGLGGGSGELGPLALDAGQLVTLNTDFEDFSGITDPAIFNPANVIDAVFDGMTFTPPPVTDGIFEFSTIKMNSGSVLRFEGTQPARLFARGEMAIQGVVDASGGDAGVHADDEIFGATAPAAGPSGGLGGDGGRLTTWVNFEGTPGTVVPPPPQPPAPTLPELNGQPGSDVSDNLLAPTGTFGGGDGGLAWPQALAVDNPATPFFDETIAHLPVDPTDISGIDFDKIFICTSKMKGGVGAGGAFGLDGGNGINVPIGGAGALAPEPPDVMGGLASDFDLGIGSDPDSPQRLLSPEDGFLHGGPGGGGGGSHIQGTTSNGQVFFDCQTVFGGGPANITKYTQHSSSAGGSGGGGLQAQAGRRVIVDGVVDVGGGQGGSKSTGGVTEVTAGGGGAGGSALIQSRLIQIANVPGRINISGGDGGFGTGGSFGGDGGAGLLRLETVPPLLDPDQEADKIDPNTAALAAVGATPGDVIGAGEWTSITVGPSGRNGSQSCWIKPEGNFFILNFLDDNDPDLPPTTTLGWDMLLELADSGPFMGQVSYRGDNPFFPGVSLEAALGNDLDKAPMVVRFQGARAIVDIDDFCDVTLEGPNAQVFPGSLTGWVKHPSELNSYFADPALRPNMFRYAIIYDTTEPEFEFFKSVTEITINTLPD